MSSTQSGGGIGARLKASKFRPVRLILACGLLLASGLGIILGYHECSLATTVGADGKVSTVQTCAPPSLTSATLFILLLIVVGLLWPDLSEISVFNVSLKRKVEATQQQAAEATTKATELGHTVQLQQLRLDALAQATASATATQQVNLYTPGWSPADTRQLKNQHDRLTEEQTGNETSTATSRLPTKAGLTDEAGPAPYADLSDAELTVRFLQRWEALNQRLTPQPPRHSSRSGEATERDWQFRALQDGFAAEYKASIDSVRQLRDALAHAVTVPRTDVELGLDTLDLLTSQADQWFEQRHQGRGVRISGQ